MHPSTNPSPKGVEPATPTGPTNAPAPAPVDPADIRGRKALLRRRIRRERARRADTPQRMRAEAQLARHAALWAAAQPGPGPVAAFSATHTEPGSLLLDALAELEEQPVLLPKIVGTGLRWGEATGPLVEGPFGIREPHHAAADLAAARCLIVPALACSPAGARLGQGGGFYDRLLSAGSGVSSYRMPVAALVFSREVTEVPVEPHDLRVDAIITEDGTLRCPAPSKRA